ncbi:tRNA epoxyqueuosine(34) reductase QueG [Saprospiraceae bacterium]|nr:tRNA epoxyqueuosine(34) reductase QueG [Saprospiraceae bacterium]
MSFNIKSFIRSRAAVLGFDQVAFARAEKMDKEEQRLETWLNQGNHGQMSYLENHFDMRVDPTKLVPGAKTVISLLFNYYPKEEISTDNNFKIARYAYGKDYHKFIRKKLKTLLFEIQEQVGPIQGRAFVDSAPILERDWARRSGLGWTGKNTLLLNKQRGSYFFLAELIIDLELEYDHPIQDHCGTCTRCIDACPTDAISPSGYVVDGSKCISYLTIELKDKLPEEFQNSMKDWIFGCDICQEVCPWNRFSTPNQESRLSPKAELMNMKKSDWEELSEEVFEQIFEGSAVRRTKYEGLKRNIDFVKRS